MTRYLKQFSLRFVSKAAGIAVTTIVVIELLTGPYVRSFESHEVDATLKYLEKSDRNHSVVLLGDSVGRGVFADWKFKRGAIAKLACNQATETAGQYFFLKRYLENNKVPGAVIVCDRSPGIGDLKQSLTENYIQRCFTRWSEILGLFQAKLDPVFTVKMVFYKSLATFKNRLHLQQLLTGFTNSDVYSGVVSDISTVKAGYGLFGVIEDALETGRGESVSQRYLKMMMTELESYGVPLYYLPPPTSEATDDSNKQVLDSLTMLRELGLQFGGLHVLEDAYIRLPKSHFSDEVHLNEQGLTSYRPAIHPLIDEILEEAIHRQKEMRSHAFTRGGQFFQYIKEEELRLIRPTGGTTSSLHGNMLLLSATTNDPAVLLPERAGVKKIMDERIGVRVDVESDFSTIARLYYADGNEAFEQGRSVRAKIEPGRNSVYFLLPSDFQGEKLRFDPGEVAGQYTVHAIEGKIVRADDDCYF